MPGIKHHNIKTSLVKISENKQILAFQREYSNPFQGSLVSKE